MLPPSCIVLNQQRIDLHQDWQLCSTAPGECAEPAQLLARLLPWREAVVPGTVAQSLGSDTDQGASFDARDWWYRCTFAEPARASTPPRLRFEGLATLAEIWLNGSLLLTADNMFVPYVREIPPHLLRAENELVICFRSLEAALAARRPRPRWKTALTSHQQLRWFRTTLLGRIPAWADAPAPVGPWKAIHLEFADTLEPQAFDLQTRVREGIAVLDLRARLRAAQPIDAATLVIGEQRHPLPLTREAADTRIEARLELPDAPLWWPHTHGTPALLDCRLEIEQAGALRVIDCGRIGFKDVSVNRDNGQLKIQINGTEVFCRGACWTSNDLRTLTGTEEHLREALTLARDAGANMLRVGGTMLYESDAFYALCDELGLLVWQDFMFANMDYPVSDEVFLANIERETRWQLQRLQHHACIALYCGGSEIEQQAAMMGLPAGEWTNPFFAERLPALCADQHAGIPYFRATPVEGALPFHTDTGIAHYYGVGAYRRPLDDVRRARVRFSAESLGFANVPAPETMAGMTSGATPAPHHPAWKAGVPRDNGAGLDFEDIRDFYLQELYGLDPVKLRGENLERYYALSRAVSGEVMSRVYAQWRRPRSECGGALVWFFKDLRRGAGWGIIDSDNRPKPVYHYLKRCWAQRAILITDEGLNGLNLHIVNENSQPLRARVELEVFQHGRIRIADAAQTISVPPRSALTLQSDALLARFIDITYSYRFGPSGHDVVAARLIAEDSGMPLSEDFYFPRGLNLPFQEAAAVSATAISDENGCVVATLESNCFLQTVSLEAKGYRADDNYFHLAPGCKKQIRFFPHEHGANKFKAYIGALNLRESITVKNNGMS